jgi:hypothetical protein
MVPSISLHYSSIARFQSGFGWFTKFQFFQKNLTQKNVPVISFPISISLSYSSIARFQCGFEWLAKFQFFQKKFDQIMVPRNSLPISISISYSSVARFQCGFGWLAKFRVLRKLGCWIVGYLDSSAWSTIQLSDDPTSEFQKDPDPNFLHFFNSVISKNYTMKTVFQFFSLVNVWFFIFPYMKPTFAPHWNLATPNLALLSPSLLLLININK